jgi:hypothetical protein
LVMVVRALLQVLRLVLELVVVEVLEALSL